jgi:hypothetical protein
MLFDISHKQSANNSDNEAAAIAVASLYDFKGEAQDSLKKHIGEKINLQVDLHFITNGRWSMPDIVFWVLNQIGPASLKIATWSISEDAIRRIINRYQKGIIQDVEFLLDPRVKVRNPNPLSMLRKNFPYAMAPNHAKVTLLSNNDHKVSIISSANLTSNPRIEVGIISGNTQVYDFHHKWITNEINRNRIK